MAQPILDVRNLHKHYPGVNAVNGIDFTVPQGICFGLLGPNGAGKTTTIEMLEGITKPTSGEIRYKGELQGARFRQEAGIQFQSTALQDFLTVRENLKFFSSLYPKGLPLDGKIHMLSDCADSDDPTLPADSCDAVATQTPDGRWLILVRDNGSLFAVTRIILHALFWGVTLTILPGIVGWHLLRRRPLRRIRGIQASAEAIVAGDLTRRLPLSNRRDELDMLAAIVNAMLERIERLMNEVKGVCDNIAHDLRTPLTRLRAQLYRMQQQAGEGSQEAAQLDSVLSEADTLMARFRGLLRISELEDRQRRSGFVQLDPVPLLQELHDFYLPLAEEDELVFKLQLPESLPALKGDRALLFEAVANLLSNSIKFTPPGGEVILRGVNEGGHTRIEVLDSGPGIPAAEREAVFQRFYRAEGGNQQSGFGLGLSIVAAIVSLHGFTLEVGDSEWGGARLVLDCRQSLIPQT